MTKDPIGVLDVTILSDKVHNTIVKHHRPVKTRELTAGGLRGLGELKSEELITEK